MGGGSKTSTVVNDPWSGMPDWVRDSFQSDIDFREGLLEQAIGLGPREILDMNPEEIAAYEDFLGGLDRSGQLSDLAATSAGQWMGSDAYQVLQGGMADRGFRDRIDALGGFDAGYDARTFDPNYQAADFEGGYDATDYRGDISGDIENTYTGQRLTDLLAGRDFEDQYVDDVVDTSLAGLQRQADRDANQRLLQQAAVGGLGGSRGAVQDALARNLDRMSMAELEAQLRSDATRFGTEALFRQAGMLDASDQFRSAQDLSAQQLATQAALEEMGLTEQSAQFLSQQNLNEQQLADASRQFLSQQGLTAQELDDASARFLSNLNLQEQELQTQADQFGLGLDRDLLGMEQDALQFGMGYDQDQARLWNQLADADLKRNLAAYDIRNVFGQQQRGIDQQQADAGRSQIDWLSGLFSGSQNKGAVPVGSTQTTTQPGQGLGQTLLGVGTSLAGAFLMSDENVKEDIEEAGGSALEKILKLGAKEYSYKDGYGHTKDRTTGLMAQDIEKAGITGAVTEIDGVKHVDPYPVLATVVQAVKELTEQKEAA